MGLISPENVCAVIVTYNIGKQIIDNVSSYINQVHKAYILDNHSDGNTIEALDLLRRYYTNIVIILNDSNHGLAAAQNIGIRLAIDGGYEWILFLDQDSQPDHCMVYNMLSLYNSLSEDKKNNIALVAPRIIDINSQKEYPFLMRTPFFFRRQNCVPPYIENIISVMNSGSLIKTEAFTKLGLFEEQLFIDYVDHDFCLRIISNHLSIIAVYDAIMYHELGKRKNYNLLNVSISPTFHNHLRRYYIYRNRIYTWKKYYYIHCFITYEISAVCYDLFRILFFENEKVIKLLYIYRGIRDSLHNKYGIYCEKER
jgi:rhamnosyltransferase